MSELTDEQIREEEEFLKGLPRINIGALFLPPIWGPAHGMWATILYYPLWAFADNVFYAVYREATPLNVIVGIFMFVCLTAGTFAFAIVSQPLAAHRAQDRGMSRETYLKREQIWAVVSVVVGLIMIAAATYYNLVLRASVGS